MRVERYIAYELKQPVKTFYIIMLTGPAIILYPGILKPYPYSAADAWFLSLAYNNILKLPVGSTMIRVFLLTDSTCMEYRMKYKICILILSNLNIFIFST